jgi:hypothetical protein
LTHKALATHTVGTRAVIGQKRKNVSAREFRQKTFSDHVTGRLVVLPHHAGHKFLGHTKLLALIHFITEDFDTLGPIGPRDVVHCQSADQQKDSE